MKNKEKIRRFRLKPLEILAIVLALVALVYLFSSDSNLSFFLIIVLFAIIFMIQDDINSIKRRLKDLE